MGRLTFIVPAAIGGIVGILLATNHENVSIIAVVALVALAVAVVTVPGVIRELTHSGGSGTLPPYAQLLDDQRVSAFRGPSLAHTKELLLLAENAYDLHFRFRPLLIDVVSDLLSLRARIDFHEHPEQAQAHLGADLWEVVRPDRPVPKGRFGDPGLSPQALQRVLLDLERIS